MRICLNDVTFCTRWMRTRFPFRYGIAAMTELPHVFLSAKVTIDEVEIVGHASEGLPPKWFTKNTETTFEQDLPEMLQAIEQAVKFGARCRGGFALRLVAKKSIVSKTLGQMKMAFRLYWLILAQASLSVL